jgi:hypothetical protein
MRRGDSTAPLWINFCSLDLLKKNVFTDVGVAQSPSQRVSVDLGVIRKNNPPAIWMLHFDMAPFPVNLNEPKALQGSAHLSPREKWQLHDSSTTSCLSSSSN